MNHYVRCLLFLWCVVLCALRTSTAQELSTKNKKAIKLFQEAELALKQRKFEIAIGLMEEAVSKDTAFIEAHLRLGSTYKLLTREHLAHEHFYKACLLRPEQADMAGAYFTTAEYFFKTGEYFKAQTYFNKANTYTRFESVKKQVQFYTACCQFALKEQAKSTTAAAPKRMEAPLNQFYMQAFPVLTADGEQLIFFRRNGLKISDNEDVMISNKENNHWSAPQSISKTINSEYNEGMCSISGDGRTLVFASCKRPDAVQAGCDIYISYKKGEDWSVPINLGDKVNSSAWDSEPSISADGRTIYFCSDRKGGMGKEDIWVTTKNAANEWMEATNLGTPVNSVGREVSPFIFANGKTLFFASDSRVGMGGYDLYYTEHSDSSWTIPTNVGYPINSSINDVSLFISTDGRKGYYSMDEREDGMLTYTRSYLYEFDVPEDLRKVLKMNTYMKGKVQDATNSKALGASLELVDLASGKVVQWVTADEVNGDYVLVLSEGAEYALHVSKQGYLFKSLHLDYRSAASFDPQILTIGLEPIRLGNLEVLNNIFFQTNSFALDNKSKVELERLVTFMNTNPNVRLELRGHTDNVGNDADNLLLSSKRAKAVYAYLLQNGISPTRLVAKGYGSTQPIADNGTEAGRLKNRRIDMKILK